MYHIWRTTCHHGRHARSPMVSAEFCILPAQLVKSICPMGLISKAGSWQNGGLDHATWVNVI